MFIFSGLKPKTLNQHPEITLWKGIHKNQNIVCIEFSYNQSESRIDLRFIQEFLGHKSSKTTKIYTHVTEKSIQKIKSQFDDL